MAKTSLKTYDGLCPFCKASLAPGAVLCVSCGFHLERGTKVDVDIAPTVTSVRDPANPFRSPGTELDEERPPRSVLSILWVRGRIPRWQWWVTQLVAYGACILVGNLGQQQLVPEAVLVVTFWVALWLIVASQIKRWHDIDRSGVWLIVNFIPLGSLYALIELGFQRGTEGSNQYGEDPLE